MAKRPYDPNGPSTLLDDPLGPQALPSPTSSAPSVARSALLSGLDSGTDAPLGDPNQPPPQTGGTLPLGDPNQPPPQVGGQLPLGNPSQPAPTLGANNPAPYVTQPITTTPDPSQVRNDPGGPAYPGLGGNNSIADTTPNGPGPDAPQSPSGSPKPHQVDATPDQVSALYAKYGLHTPNGDEIENWLNGTYGDVHSLADIEAQIASSGEAQAYTAAHGGSTATKSGSGVSSSDLAQSMLTRLNAPGQQMSAQDMVNEFNQAYPQAAAKYYNDSRGETIGFPDGYLAKTPSGWTWTVRGPENGSGAAAPAPTSGTGGGGYQPVPTSPYNQQLRDFMMSQLGTLSQPIGADSGELAPAIGAYDTQSQRDQQTERDQIAEHAYAGGNLDSGSLDTQIAQGREKASGNRANFTGSMVFQANTQRKQQLQAMLQTATSAGLTDQAQQIQQAIAQIDASLRGDQLGFNYAQLMANLNRDALLGGLNG